MYPARFRYLRASDVDEALDSLAELGPEARVLAGGASLIPQLKYRQVVPAPKVLIDLGRLDALRGTVRENGHVVVGAMTRHVEAGEDAVLAAALPGACDAARSIGDQQVRNMGTVGGGLVAVEPTGDWGPCLLAAQGRVRVSNRQGNREIDARELFAAPLRSTLSHDELLTGVVFPAGTGRSGSAHCKLYIRAVTALGSCSVSLTLTDTDRVASVGVGVGGLTPTPVAVPEVAAVLVGHVIDAASVDAARHALVTALNTHSDSRTTAAHRSSVAGSLFRKALRTAQSRATGADSPPVNSGGWS